ncbi:MAG: outer membrane porin [Oceanicaulis sp. HLUCCA04]|nr:MAG: outer membrane porin [Oceanicaulis sp. HLUCCA04]
MKARCADVLALVALAAAPVPGLTMAGAALAQDVPAAFDTSIEFDADILLSPGATDAANAGPYGEIRLGLTTDRILENTHQIGFAGTLVARRDSGRAGLGQSVGDCPPGIADCFSVGGLAPVGTFSGLTAVSGIAGDDPAIGVETAFVYWRGGYVEVRGGYGPGAAALESEPLPGAFWLMRADAARIDPSGRNLASTTNTLSGHAPKILVQSVRLAGFRAAASFTPDRDVCGATYCRADPVPGVLAAARVRHIAELGLSFDHRFAQAGVRWTAGLGLSHGQASGPDSIFYEDPWALSARIIRSEGPWTAGVSALISNEGVSGAAYRAQSASVSYESGDWLFSLEASGAQSSLVHARSHTLMAAASRFIEPGIIVGAGIEHTDAERAAVQGGVRTGDSSAGTRVFLEAGLRF